MGVKELLAEAKGLPTPEQVRVAAILGAVVADAAFQPIHWIYNQDAMKKAVSGCPDAPEFLPISANPFYCIPTGNQSLYGDQLLVMLESLVESKCFNPKNSAEKLFQNFGPNSPYDRSEQSKLYSKGMKDKSMYPIDGKWQGFLLRRFVKCYSEGKTVEEEHELDDTNVDPDNLVRNIPLTLLLAGKPELLETLRESLLQMQTNDMMIVVGMAVSRLIERYILDAADPQNPDDVVHPLKRVIEDLKCPDRACADSLDKGMVSHLNEVLENKTLSIPDAHAKFGIS